MKILITGAAGNLGSLLTGHLLETEHRLNLMVHDTPVQPKFASAPRSSVYRADLAQPNTLDEPVAGVNVIVHFAGRLFAPRPENFLYETNVIYVRNLVDAAIAARVDKFILVSFPHVEGESTPEEPARGHLNGDPDSIHAQTRLEAERYLFESAADIGLVPIALRPGMIYARGILMIDAARRLLKHRLLGVWPDPTWIHLIALPDFLEATTAAIEHPQARGIYNLGDKQPITLQTFLDLAAEHWGYAHPWRAPAPLFYLAAGLVELYATLMRTPAPLTRDFIRIGRASYVSDTTRMRRDLLGSLKYPNLSAGLDLL